MRPTRFYSNKQEKAVAKAVGGKQTPNSGATPFSKGDVVTPSFLIECKTCTKPQTTFTMRKEWFVKNRAEAFAMHKDYSAVAFDFGDGEVYYAISSKLFNMLQAIIEEEYYHEDK